MNSETHENQSLAKRLEKLQKEIRWIKRIGIATAAVVAGLILIYHHERYRSVTAQEFVLTDSGGRERAKLALLPEGAGLEIYAASGEPRVQLVGGGEEATLNLSIPVTAGRSAAAVNFLQNDALLATFRANGATALLAMHPRADKGAAALSLKRGSASLTLSGPGEGAPKVSLETDATHACAALDGAAEPSAKGALCLHSPGLPTLELTDLAGNRALLGVKQTAHPGASEPQMNSAASVALEHKGGKNLQLGPR
jgi:hypothetical protein